MRHRTTGGLSLSSIADSNSSNFLELTTDLGRLRVLVNGGYMAAQCTSNQEPFAKFGIVPKAEFQLTKFPPQHQPLNSPRNAHRIDGDEPFPLLSDH